jgi:hypothetical protein
MNACALRLALLLVLLAAPCGMLRAADEPEADTKPRMKDVLRARMAEEANKKPAPAQPAPAQAAAATEQKPDKAPAPAKPTAPAPKEEKPSTKTADQPATVLPKVEVKKGRITELDQQIAKQEQEIAREKKNIKPTETDLALNDSKIAKPLSIFGGESAQFRKRVASERVELMEAEKDILEAMKLARTKEEKAKLQKELDELRAIRRDLEKSLR